MTLVVLLTHLNWSFQHVFDFSSCDEKNNHLKLLSTTVVEGKLLIPHYKKNSTTCKSPAFKTSDLKHYQQWKMKVVFYYYIWCFSVIMQAWLWLIYCKFCIILYSVWQLKIYNNASYSWFVAKNVSQAQINCPIFSFLKMHFPANPGGFGWSLFSLGSRKFSQPFKEHLIFWFIQKFTVKVA